MKKILKITLLLLLNLAILLFCQTEVDAAETAKNITSIQELNEVFGGKAIISGNTLILNENITITDEITINIKIPEAVIDFNGKTITFNRSMKIYNKLTFKDSLNGGGITFNNKSNIGISIEESGELIIDNGNFINNSKFYLFYLDGKLTINKGNFITNDNGTEELIYSNMFQLGKNSEFIINGGVFNSVNSIIRANAIANNCKITINGGNFKCTNGYSAIQISAEYPYVDENNQKHLIVPKVVLNNCNISHENGSAISFWGGCVDEEFKNVNTQILTIKGGNYSGTMTAFHMTHMKYFNYNDIIIENGDFELLKSNGIRGAISIEIPENSEFKYNGEFERYLINYKGKIYESDVAITTMEKVVFTNKKVISAEGELRSSFKNVVDMGSDEEEKIPSQIVKKVDAKTNIKLESQSDIVPDNTTMDVTEITEGETFNQIKNNFTKIEKFKAFDITLKSDNTKIQPNGKVKISIPIPVGFDDSKLVIYRLDTDGTKTEYQVTVANGYAIFETDHFSTYILGEKSEVSNETQGNADKNIGGTSAGTNNTKLPQTGEETNAFVTWLSTVVLLGIFWLVSMLLIDREKKKMIKK